MNIFTQVKQLNLPLGQYVVVGSGSMSAKGIREHKDVDLLVTPDLYRKLKADGWKVVQKRDGFEVVVLGDVEASPEMITLSNYKPNIYTIIENSEIINGIALSNLKDVRDFKQALGREKDLKDIKLIDDFLSKYFISCAKLLK